MTWHAWKDAGGKPTLLLQSESTPEGQTTLRRVRPEPQLALQGLQSDTTQSQPTTLEHASPESGRLVVLVSPEEQSPTEPLEHATVRERLPEPHLLLQLPHGPTCQVQFAVE